MKQLLIKLGILCALSSFSLYGRSIYRPKNPAAPKLVTQWANGKSKNEVSSTCLEIRPLFKTFDKTFLENNLLPTGTITYRNRPQQSVEGIQLTEQIEQLLQEINRGRKDFAHFAILAKSDFDYKEKCGLLILKFKDHPFVLKLFIENPKSFTHPRPKGFEQWGMFYLGGGVNRHLLGFTRIKNAQNIHKILSKSPEWAHRTDVPRKWFWQPKNNRLIKLTGINFTKQKITKFLPSVYGILADEIKAERTLSFVSQADRKLSMQISDLLQGKIDPNISNFIIEKETQKIVIIDTEHFHILANLEKPYYFRNFFNWYTKLAGKFLKRTMFRTKKERYRNLT